MKEMDLFGMDNRLPSTASDCMQVGLAGGCGATCPVFTRGDCDEPQEITKSDVLAEYDIAESIEIFALYDCFGDGMGYSSKADNSK